jgi:hypothetical protein
MFRLRRSIPNSSNALLKLPATQSGISIIEETIHSSGALIDLHLVNNITLAATREGESNKILFSHFLQLNIPHPINNGDLAVAW